MRYDSIIIGGGPAGQSAAIYLARFNRKVLVIDRGTSRTLTFELNENYLGFPQGIHSRNLYELGRQQAERFGVVFVDDEVSIVQKTPEGFNLAGLKNLYQARSLILATGVTDLYPNVPDYQSFLGKSLFWCITCDGYKTLGKRVVLIGDTNEAACTATQFHAFTPDITLITNYEPGRAALGSEWRQKLAHRNIKIVEGVVSRLVGENGYVTEIELSRGHRVPANMVFNLQGAIPNNTLASELGVTLNTEGYIETTDNQRTNIPFVYAAGDVTRMFAHQIVTAAHEGSMAGQAANYDLYDPDQRMEE